MEIKKPDSHLIVCSHPYMQSIGLGTMTTGSLNDWWLTKNGEGLYINQSHFFPVTPAARNEISKGSLELVFGSKSDDDDDNVEWSWYGWKPNPDVPNDGRYVKQNLHEVWGAGNQADEWAYSTKQGNHTLTDTKFADFNGVSLVDGSNVSDDGTFSMGENNGTDAITLMYDHPIKGLANLNKYMNALDNWFPRDTWEVDDRETFGNLDPSQAFANLSFLDDIKSSKGGRSAISWSGEVTIYVNDGNGFFKGSNCSITEWIPFTMYLYDDVSVPVQSNGVAMRSSTIVAPRRDVLGKSYSTSSDGGWGEPTDTAGSNAAAELDISLNPITKKWESGTPNLFAKLVTELPALANSPDVDRLLESDIKVDLDGEDFLNRFVVSSGTAMPIRVQNGNNLQWTPNYLNSDEARCSNPGDLAKETLTVYNFSPERTFRKNENVMLSRIDGRWIVSQLGIDPSGKPDPPSLGGEAGKWGEFTYMMTNSKHFFKGFNNAQNVDIEYIPQDMEVDFHVRYYKDRVTLSDVDDSLKEFDFFNDPDYTPGLDYNPVSGGYDSSVGFVRAGHTQININHGFAQTTSFDCLDSKLFGLRGQGGGPQENKNAIASTNPLTNSAGKSIPTDPTDWVTGGRNGALTAGFFGALFPDGYEGTSRFFNLGDDDEEVTFSAVGYGNSWNDRGVVYLNKDPVTNKEGPFIDSDPTGFGGRNNVINPTRADPTAEQEVGEQEWRRLETNTNFPSAASLLYRPSVGSIGLEHIPADVATNAGPAGKNGSPIKPVHRFVHFHALDGNWGASYQSTRALIRNEFVAAGATGADSTNGLAFESAFDLKPVNPNNIMFRPLKLESYAQFGSLKATQCELGTDGTPNASETTRQSRVGFEQEIHRTQNDGCRPVTHLFEDRELGTGATAYGLYDTAGKKGLKYAGDIEFEDRRSYGTKLHKIAYWTRETNVRGAFGNGTDGAFMWAQHPDYEKGGNAFGVITSFTTVNATSTIDFTTDNLYGMASSQGRSNNQTGNLKRVAAHSWGQNTLTNSFRGHNYPDLSVRIFHEHPRDQTLYDPRTMAVHHFNPDPLYKDERFTYWDPEHVGFNSPPLEGCDDIGEGRVIDPRKPRNHLKKSQQGVGDVDGESQITQFWYNQPQISGAVDFVVPSRFAYFPKPVNFPPIGNSSLLTQHAGFAAEATADNIFYSEIVPTGTMVFDDVTVEPSNEKALQPKIMDESFWQINTQRVGKLLPFRWYETVMGIYAVSFDRRDPNILKDDGTVVDLITNENGGLNPSSTMTLIDGGSSGFTVGDLFGRQANNLIMQVDSIGESGSIASFSVLDPGIFPSNAGNALSDKATKGFKGGIVLETIKGEGELEWSFVNTMVYKRERIDPKPLMVKKDGASTVRIASPKILPTHPNGSLPLSESQAASFINEQHEVSFVLDQDNLAENSAYDVFFHFHNDITMTWLSGKRKFFGSDPSDANDNPVVDQFISARISTT